jgi:hypothetical protein
MSASTVNGIKVYPLAKAGEPVAHRLIDVAIIFGECVLLGSTAAVAAAL